ncbi:unnamed protein product [Caenorhabditis angaria]|uniref:Uncharacterized protein n=1 Tax=Caenorhabditis angaria TaxID=860376 RepID=A0A9P1I780_9PELO|nr:unnamed protein product [Caenorhabditis angaria]
MVHYIHDISEFERHLSAIFDENAWTTFIFDEKEGKIKRKDCGLEREEIPELLRNDELCCILTSEVGSRGGIFLLWTPIMFDYKGRSTFEQIFKTIGTQYEIQTSVLNQELMQQYFNDVPNDSYNNELTVSAVGSTEIVAANYASPHDKSPINSIDQSIFCGFQSGTGSSNYKVFVFMSDEDTNNQMYVPLFDLSNMDTVECRIVRISRLATDNFQFELKSFDLF